MMSTAIMHQSALYDFGDLFLKVSCYFIFCKTCQIPPVAKKSGHLVKIYVARGSLTVGSLGNY